MAGHAWQFYISVCWRCFPALSAAAQTRAPARHWEDFSENNLLSPRPNIWAPAERWPKSLTAFSAAMGNNRPARLFVAKKFPYRSCWAHAMAVAHFYSPMAANCRFIGAGPAAKASIWAQPAIKRRHIGLNIDEPQDLYRRFAGVDGSLVALGGVGFNYLQRGNTKFSGALDARSARQSNRRQSRL